ncbi:MAG: AAA family ATPase [Alphaproteobacteria bacterium]|nr:AAA family ATPase [Alphaproteobacteria bacterium]
MSTAPEDVILKFGRRDPKMYGRLKVFTLGDEQAKLARPYLLKGIIYRGDLIFITGDPGSGKTTLTQYIALAVAQGRSIFGRRVKVGRVLYLAFEGKDIFLLKMSVLEKRFGSSRNIMYATQSLQLLKDAPNGPDANELLKLIKDEKIDLVVCDTWSKMLAGADDNKHETVSALIGVLDRIREEVGAAVLVNAHPSKSDKGGVGGSFTVQKDADAVLSVEIADSIRTVNAVKLRFDKIGPTFSFKLERVVLGTDDDGDEITSVDIQEESNDPPHGVSKPTKLSAFQSIFLKDFENHTAITRPGPNDWVIPKEGMPRVIAVGRKEMVAELQKNGRLESSPGQPMTSKDRTKLRDTLAALESKGRLFSTDAWIWKP